VHESLKHVFRDIGFPKALRPDDAASLTGGEFRRIANKGQVPIHSIEPYHPNQNLAEDTIREGTRMYHRFLSARGIPQAVWDRVFMYCLELRSHMALGHPFQGADCGATIVKGTTADISHLVDFGIYDWCWALSPTNVKQDSKQLARWLGPSFDVGASLCFAVLTARGKIIHRSSVIPLSTEERHSEDLKELRREFTTELTHRLGKKAGNVPDADHDEPINVDQRFIRPMDAPENHTPEFERHEPDGIDESWEEPSSEETQQLQFEKCVGARLRKNDNGIDCFGIVKHRKRGPDGNLIGIYHENPRLDGAVYHIEWEDGNVDAYFANQIVESIMMNIDADGNTILHLKELSNQL